MFRKFLMAKRGTVEGSLLAPRRTAIFTPTEKQPGDLVLGSGYKWERVS